MLRYYFLILVLLAPLSVWAEGASYNVGVNGLTCPFCTYGVEKHLLKLDGVEGVETNIEDGFVVVTMQDDKELEKSQVEKAVRKAGFSLRSFE